MSDASADLREALRALRGVMPGKRGGRTSFCCHSNGGTRTEKPIASAQCVCSAEQRLALEVLRKHGAHP